MVSMIPVMSEGNTADRGSTVGGDAEDARPGALLLDLLGDLNRTGHREMRLKALVALGETIGASGPTVRVTLARLRERGWFLVRREGRESVYRLTTVAVSALDDGGRRIFRDAPQPWARQWSMAIYTVPESDRQTRDELRKRLGWLGFGPLAPATWICPYPRLEEIADAAATLPAARLTLLTTCAPGLAADRALAARCWDLDALGIEYHAFVTAVRARMPLYRQAAADGRAAALIERVRLVNEYRRLAGRDPQLPEELQPTGWPGEEARRVFGQAHSLLAASSAAHYARLLDAI